MLEEGNHKSASSVYVYEIYIFYCQIRNYFRFNNEIIQFSHRYGYGLMDAGAMAYLARDWQNVPKMQRTCQKGIVKSSRAEHRSISQWVC